MNSRVNVLHLGQPEDVLSVLASMSGEENTVMERYLRLALVNAFNRIEALERRVEWLRETTKEEFPR